MIEQYSIRRPGEENELKSKLNIERVIPDLSAYILNQEGEVIEVGEPGKRKRSLQLALVHTPNSVKTVTVEGPDCQEQGMKILVPKPSPDYSVPKKPEPNYSLP